MAAEAASRSPRTSPDSSSGWARSSSSGSGSTIIGGRRTGPGNAQHPELLRFRTNLDGDARELDEQPLEIDFVLLRRHRVLPRFEILDLRLQIRLASDQRR